MSECKECGVPLEEGAACMVAHWAFCKPCFDALMTKESPEEEPPSNVEEKTVSCNVCQCIMLESESHAMVGLRFCKACYQALIYREPEPDPVEEEEAPPEFKTPQVNVDHTETISCDSCGRMIPRLGASPLGEQLLCPDCFYRDNPEMS